MRKANRITIFGLPGSGKSTFSLALQNHRGLPLYHIDRWFWQAGWRERPSDEFRKILAKFIQEDAWIIEGNAMSSLEMRYARAQTVFYFCPPRLVCLFRIFKRFWEKHPDILDRAEGCPERVSWKLIRYMWQFEKRYSPLIARLQETYPHVQFIRVTEWRASKKSLLQAPI